MVPAGDTDVVIEPLLAVAKGALVLPEPLPAVPQSLKLQVVEGLPEAMYSVTSVSFTVTHTRRRCDSADAPP